MIFAPQLEQAKAFINAQISSREREPLGVIHQPTGPFVTISREAGSGSSALAKKLADELNERNDDEGSPWTVFNQNLVEQMLADEHLSPRLARFMPEARVSEVDASVGEILGLHPNLWALLRRTADFMRELAKHGNVILIGRGANFATARLENGIHVRLVAPAAKREAHMAKVLNISTTEARHQIRKIDAQRRDFVRSLFNTDIANPTAYDIILNMGRMDTEAATAVIARMVRTPVYAG